MNKPVQSSFTPVQSLVYIITCHYPICEKNIPPTKCEQYDNLTDANRIRQKNAIESYGQIQISMY